MTAPPGVNLVAHFSDGVGLGNTAAAVLRVLRARGVAVSAWHLPHPWGGARRDDLLDACRVADPAQLPHPCSLYLLPTPGYATLFDDWPALAAPGRRQVANVWWEASQLPPAWAGFLDRFDALLALSDFVAGCCRTLLPDKPVLTGAHPLDLPPAIRPERRRFGIADDAVAFVASFDPNSDPARKNPEGVVAAFRRAFPRGDEAVGLAIRVNNAGTAFAGRVLAHLRQLASGDRRIAFIDDPLTYAEVLGLYAAADVHVSLHRGEGLGLGMLESMALGRPVIATAWSGNLDYMRDDDSALVPYRLVPVQGHYAFFRPGVLGPDARWAEPDLDAAAAWMRRLAGDPGLRQRLGAAAAAAARAYQARALAAGWIDGLDPAGGA